MILSYNNEIIIDEKLVIKLFELIITEYGIAVIGQAASNTALLFTYKRINDTFGHQSFTLLSFLS